MPQIICKAKPFNMPAFSQKIVSLSVDAMVKLSVKIDFDNGEGQLELFLDKGTITEIKRLSQKANRKKVGLHW